MNSYKHLSGAAKRKKKQEQIEKVHKLRKIDSFFVSNFPVQNEVQNETSSGTSTSTEFVNTNVTQYESNISLGEISSLDVDAGPSVTMEESLTDVIDCSDVSHQDEKITCMCDKGRFGPQLSDKEKQFIINCKPCQPPGPFPKDARGKNFSEYFYIHVNKSGIKTARSWLCYSIILNKCYCQPCWLFSHKIENVFANGYSDWTHLYQGIKRHERSAEHNACCAVYDRWKLNKTIDFEQEKLIREEVSFWRTILERVINITLMLATSNLPFRGHDENYGSDNQGVFLSVTNLLSKYDPVFKNLLENRTKKSVTYLSPQIQNEIISLLGNAVKNEILKEIKKSSFYSIIVDTTQDISKVDQLSLVFRYIHVETFEERPTKIVIKESFLEFIPITDQIGNGLSTTVINYFNTHGLDLSKLRGQGYDGAANMSGIYNGVQAKISSLAKNAPYVHCAAHSLNLVLNESVKNVDEVRNFYDVVERVYIFFGHSIKRWTLLATLFDSDNKNSKITLKKLAPTRWSSRHDALKALRIRYTDVLKSLSKIMLTSSSKAEIEEAQGLRTKLEQFESVFLIILETKILSCVDVVSKCLQDKQQNIQEDAKLLVTACNNLKMLRDNFDNVKFEAICLAQKWGACTQFQTKRIRRPKRYFDESKNHYTIETSEDCFRINVFLKTLDTAIHQLKNRSATLVELSEIFKVLNTEILMHASDSELIQMGKILYVKYNDDISDAVCEQLISFRQCFREDLATIKSPLELLEFIVIKNYSSSSSFTDIITACYLFLTIPVTVATSERSFSKLKLIKNYLRSSMNQDRLSALAIISIENSLARQIDLNTLINDFANAKAGKVSFR